MKYRFVMIGSLLSSLSYVHAEFQTTPYFLSLENLEHKFVLKNDFYTFEKRADLRTDINGIAYFFPKFLENSTVSYSSRVINEGVDAYVFASSTVDLCADKVQNTSSLNETELLALRNSNSVAYLSYRNLIRVDFDQSISHQPFWFYIYPKIKKDHIYKRSNDNFIVYQYPVVVNFSYKFRKEDVDTFVTTNNISIEKCDNKLTYLDKQGYDYLIRTIEPYLTANKLPILYATDLQSFSQLEEYIDELKNAPNQDATTQRTITTLYYKILNTRTKAEETKNLCNYINYLITTPEYTSELNHPITITNSCPVKGTISQLNTYIKYFINGYKISGDFRTFGDKTYVVTPKLKVYEFTEEDGCNVEAHPVTDDYLLNQILRLPKSGDYLNIYDWDNDTDKRFDCIKVQNNIAYKFDEINGSSYVSKPLQFPVTRKNNIVVFDKTQTISSDDNQPNTTPSISSSTPMSSVSSTTSSMSSSHSNNVPQPFPGQENDTNSMEEEFTPIPQSSSSTFSSSSSSSSAQTVDPVVKALANKQFPIDGFFIHYGEGDLDWVYVSNSTGRVYKLEGLRADGKFNWRPLSNTIEAIRNGNSFRFIKK